MATYYARFYGWSLTANVYLFYSTSSNGTYTYVGNIAKTSSYLSVSHTTSLKTLYFRLSSSSSSSGSSYEPNYVLTDISATGVGLGSVTSNYTFSARVSNSSGTSGAVYYTLSYKFPIKIYGLNASSGKACYLLRSTSESSTTYYNMGEIAWMPSGSYCLFKNYNEGSTQYFTLSGSSSSVTYTPYRISSVSNGTKISDKKFSVSFPSTEKYTTINAIGPSVTVVYDSSYGQFGSSYATSPSLNIYAGVTNGAKTIDIVNYYTLTIPKGDTSTFKIYFTGGNDKPCIVNGASTTSGATLSYSGNYVSGTNITADSFTIEVKVDADYSETGGIYFYNKKAVAFFSPHYSEEKVLNVGSIYWGNQRVFTPHERDWDDVVDEVKAMTAVAGWADLEYVNEEAIDTSTRHIFYCKDDIDFNAYAVVADSDECTFPNNLGGWLWVCSVTYGDNPYDYMPEFGSTCMYLLVPSTKGTYCEMYRRSV